MRHADQDADGTIHPKLSERQAKELPAKVNGSKKQPRKWNLRLRLQRFGDFVRETVNDWQPEERNAAKAELTRLIEQIESWPSLELEARVATSRDGKSALEEFSWRVGSRTSFKLNQPE